MRVLGQKSLEKLKDVAPDLQELARKVMQVMNITVLTGHRGKEEQDKAVAEGKSKTPWPTGKHNSLPSQAIDISPWPIPLNWGSPGPDKVYNREEMKAVAQFYYMQGVAAGVANEMGIKVRGGHDWNMDNDFSDNNFDDLVHIELAK